MSLRPPRVFRVPALVPTPTLDHMLAEVRRCYGKGSQASERIREQLVESVVLEIASGPESRWVERAEALRAASPEVGGQVLGRLRDRAAAIVMGAIAQSFEEPSDG